MSGSFMAVLENGTQQPFAETLAIIAEQTAKVKANPLAGLDAVVTCWTINKNGNMEMKRGLPVAVVSFAGAIVGGWLDYLFSMVSENGISYFVIISNLFMALKFFMPSKQKKENLTSAEERKA